ncbi:MAG: 16S rRNA (cytidine(1402)-2'-O)-methyltransferase [Oceanospirillaceae bacterium]|uniref:16S rRNA (cytidine(1402)-2'-O)-methyltransferase n=1 Tax=unclassified Thalassolituus TaxID=2624967 RepID=UPI000C09423D|nr:MULTISPECIES: 16S rRNA (cytidine(1402)-2'-O)-methyltransferase [unclassified Thalassolituus]MAK90114.1 16S rRNA (cytidine(1402)-2'-O)-methyltransferase [Thalassolituus sp.]MAS26444.1 16S rRNA (cytidine(1402)-2'-O)-methyltransferase [Oceanospirillaceae bacterium]MAX98263.1 16S rRNA (cytidine(1402)-2'-O)-methyltransferase [Oceanospirillaceae bacterium]MBS54178.1 16S rRNA (cytidine(1402)-2'-O)-methyltransferase [Oceanospirillaceae bacterium]|tara:strand:- start:752 stop:1612 length:861 start_codon:yes stop_codon:yes gene_type:complete
MTSASRLQAGTLYIVATPIGNLSDLTERAKQVLASVDVIACEDTRHTQKLLQHLGIRKPLLSVHEHNERERTEQVIHHLRQGQTMALVSDAGTPLISDPGFPLVQALRSEGLNVSPVPGVSAIITALSAAGLPTDRFTFEGFLPHKAGGKREKLEAQAQEPRTLVYYEAKHRIIETLQIMAEVFGPERPACVARELTKTFETFYPGTLPQIIEQISADDDQQKGEFVVMIAGNPDPAPASEVDMDKLFRLLLVELPPKKAAAIVAELSGENKKALYQKALEIQGKA